MVRITIENKNKTTRIKWNYERAAEHLAVSVVMFIIILQFFIG